MAEARGPVLTQESPAVRSLRLPGHALYPNAVGSCGVVMPPGPGARIQTELSDGHFEALMVGSGLGLVSVYLPDSGKSDNDYREAIDEVAAALDTLRRLHKVRRFMVVGDWNCELSACDAESSSAVFGPLLPLRVSRRFAERQQMVSSLCSQFGLVHGPSWLDNGRTWWSGRGGVGGHAGRGRLWIFVWCPRRSCWSVGRRGRRSVGRGSATRSGAITGQLCGASSRLPGALP